MTNDMEKLMLRTCSVNNLTRLLRIENRCFENPWTINMLVSEILNPDTHFLCLWKDDEMLGYISLWLVLDTANINNIAIDIPFQNKGYGSYLLTKSIEALKSENINEVTLEVRQSNESALRLYRSNGFEIIGVRKDYYRKPTEDAYIMSKSI
ncbi:MAG: ribosomal protein S18-alanine N-acetyltransferase [Eubacteriales bacterium]|nr:ribosomal protein S18-alanine N-acetyltransferase [Eubacteriales bacterium]